MKKSSNNTIKRRLSTEKPHSKSALSVKKKRINLKDDIRQDRPLSEKEKHALKRTLSKIESAMLYDKGLNRISGGFSKTIIGELDRDEIDVTLVYGVEGTSSEEEKIVINRKTMDRVSKKEEGGSMKAGGKTGGSGWGDFKKGERITDFSNVKEGDILLEHSNQFNADNVVEVTKIRKEYPNDKGAIKIINGRFVDPNNTSKLRIGADPDGFSIWDYDLKREDFYLPKEKHKTKEEGGYMAKGGEIKNQYKGKKAQEVWNIWTKDQRSHFLLDHSELLDNDRLENDLGYSRTVQKDKSYDELTPHTKRVLGAHIESGQYSSGGSISPEKARKILHDGEVHGKPLTEEQRKFFGARASGYPVKRKEEGGYAAGGKLKGETFYKEGSSKWGLANTEIYVKEKGDEFIVYDLDDVLDTVKGKFSDLESAKEFALSYAREREQYKGSSMATGGGIKESASKTITYPTERLTVKDQSIEERELQLFIENDADLYRQRTVPIQTNLVTKIARGEFDINKAPLIYKYLIDDGIKKYNKELGPGMSLTKEEKDNLAKTFVNEFLDEAQYGNYENYLPKKYKPKEGGSMAEGGSVEDSGKYQINIHGEKPEDYKIVCTITRSGGKEVQVCYHERNDKKKKGVEIYSGKNYIVGSNDPSHSRRFDLEDVPVKYKDIVRDLKKEHSNRFEGGGSMAKGGTVSKNEDVISEFLHSNKEVHTKNLSSHYNEGDNEMILRNYGTIIATRKNKKVFITNKKYSVTTSTIQNKVERMAKESGFSVERTNEFSKGGSMARGGKTAKKSPKATAKKPVKKSNKEWNEVAISELRKQEGDEDIQESRSIDGGFEAESGSTNWLVFESEDKARDYAIEQVKQDLDDSPENFTQSWLNEFIYVTDTDRRVIAGEEADRYVEDIEDEDEKEKVHDDIYNQWYDGLENPVDFLVNEQGIYSVEDLLKQSFIRIDTDKAAEDAVDTDGIGHFLARYDGEEINLPSGAVAYKN